MLLLCRTNEAVTLLSLLPGSAHLLDGVLSTCTDTALAMSNMMEAVKALSDVGVQSLTPAQARHILKQRIH